jgi:phosphoenolpyruvate synthase/pyruvate phosphate dikinase
MKAIIILLALIFLSGCSLAAHSIKDTDKHIQDIIKADTTLSVECQAGFFSGISVASDTSLKMKTAVQAIDALVPDKTNPEYVRCKSRGISIAVLAIATNEKIDEIMAKILSLGFLP